jgi:hypothetical protein
MSSHVAALGLPESLQLIPHANHLARRLIMSGEVVFYATKLTELEAVNHCHWSSLVELLHPHSHAHIFHLE